VKPRELLDVKISRLRRRGYRGTPIKPHRSIYHIALHPGDLLIAVLLPLAFNALMLVCFDGIVALWRTVFEFWLTRLQSGAAVLEQAVDLDSYILWLPIPGLSASVPGVGLWWGTLGACVLLFLATRLIHADRFLPLIYVIRACLLIQATALAFFYVLPGSFPYDLQTYLSNSLTIALFFFFLVPWILGLSYYVFDFPLLQKITLTSLVLLYFLIALPMQYLLHAFILQSASLLFLPICYLVFGIFIDVMMLVALYSWGMSWRFKSRLANRD
jgi:hypothetical protein